MVFWRAKQKVLCLTGIILSVFFASCSSGDPFVRLDEAVLAEENYALGLAVIDESLAPGGEAIYDADLEDGYPGGGNAISLLLDKGVIAHYAALGGQAPEEGMQPVSYGVSAESFGFAEEKIEDAKAGSAIDSLLTYIANDNSRDYGGEIYEDIYLTIFNALNYYQMGQLDNAIALARSVNEKITAYSDEIGKSLDVPSETGDAENEEDGETAGAAGKIMSAIRDSLNSIVAASYSQLGAGPEPVQFTNSALANYLAALAFRTKGDEGNARVSLVNLNKAFTQKGVYNHPVPASLVTAGDINQETAEELQIPAGKARLNVIAFAGLSPLKKEVEVPVMLPLLYFPNLGIKPISLFLPGLLPRQSAGFGGKKIQVKIDGGQVFDLELLEDIGAVMRGVFREKIPSIMFKTFLRVAAKLIAVEALAAQYTDSTLVQLAVTIPLIAAINATEGADIRMGRYFPNSAYVGGITLEPGIYTITVTYPNGYVLRKENFEVKAGGLNLLEAVNLR